jgi:hypothetical protein
MTGSLQERLSRFLPADPDILAVIIIPALALRIYFALAYDVAFNAGYDEDFLYLSRLPLPAGDGAPLYPLLLKVITFLSGGSAAGARVFNALVDTATVLGICCAGAWISSRKAGLTAAAITAVYPGFVLGVISLTPAVSVVFLASLILAAGAALDSGRLGERAHSVIGAGAAALGILTAPFLVFLVPGLLAVSRRKVLFILVLIGMLLPWTVRNSIAERAPVPLYRSQVWAVDLSKFSGDLAMGHWKIAKELYENARILTSRGWAVKPDEASSVAEANSTYAAAYSYIIVMVLGVVGLVRRFRRGMRSAAIPFIFYYFLLVVFTVFAERYRTVLEPLLILYAAIFLFGSPAPEPVDGGSDEES